MDICLFFHKRFSHSFNSLFDIDDLVLGRYLDIEDFHFTQQKQLHTAAICDLRPVDVVEIFD